MIEERSPLRRRHWIPPLALVYAQAAHGFSWILIFWAAWSGNFGNVLYGFAWIHTVALAWITMAALAILIFAIPQFTGAPWRGQTIARTALAVYGAGAAFLVWAFLADLPLLGAGGIVVLGALLAYLGCAVVTLAGAARSAQSGRVQRAVARAFAITFAFLLAAAVMGALLARMLSGGAVYDGIAPVPAAHAALGTLGWLSLLIFGVSMRTLRPITGDGTRFRLLHIAVGSFGALGAAALAGGLGAHIPWLSWAGGALFGLAALTYAFDTLDIVRRSTVEHRPPQAFVVASVAWFLTALALGAGTLAGKPWQEAYVFVLLAGWAGQMVDAHVYHIGIRLLATVFRGEDDETRPQDLLDLRLSWYSFAALQLGVAIVTAALLRGDAALAARGAIFGLGGWIAMAANIFVARLRAAKMPA